MHAYAITSAQEKPCNSAFQVEAEGISASQTSMHSNPRTEMSRHAEQNNVFAM